MRRRVKYVLAPGGAEELHAATGLVVVAPVATADDANAVIVGPRADAPGLSPPGTRDGYECRFCRANVRLAPSGQRMAAKGAPVVCLECEPRLSAD